MDIGFAHQRKHDAQLDFSLSFTERGFATAGKDQFLLSFFVVVLEKCLVSQMAITVFWENSFLFSLKLLSLVCITSCVCGGFLWVPPTRVRFTEDPKLPFGVNVSVNG